MELITVIVPIYKAEKYLDRCVSSIVKQTYSELEIILIDDGSPDMCPKICDRWNMQDSRIKVLHQKNSGVSMSRNVGIKSAKGNYIMMVDSDDYLCPNMIENMYNTLCKKNVDLVICGFEKGKDSAFEFIKRKNETVEIIDAEEALKRIYIDDERALQYVAPWGKLYKKQLFEGINYPKGKIFEDIYVTHQLLYRCKKIAVLSQKLVYYFQHSTSIMNSGFHIGKLDYLEALKERVEFFEKCKLRELEEIAYDEYIHALIWEYSRARDLLFNKNAMKNIMNQYRTVYRKGYSSKRYSQENRLFLYTFNWNPELIILYWKIKGKLKK